MSNRRTKSIAKKGDGNIFIDLGYPEAEAINIVARLQLMLKIEKIIRHKNWTQKEAAQVLGLSQSRVSELMTSHFEKFTLDKLMILLDKLGKRVVFTVRDK